MNVTLGLNFPHHTKGLLEQGGLPRWAGLVPDVRAPTVCTAGLGMENNGI